MTIAAGWEVGTRRPGSASRRVDRWRWDVLDAGLNLSGVVYPVGGRPPTVTVSIRGRVNRACRGVVLTAADAEHLNPARDFIRPVYTDARGAEWPQGVFRVVDATVTDRQAGDWQGAAAVDLTLADNTVRLQAQTHRSLSFRRDTPVSDAAVELAGWLSIPEVRIDPNSARLAEPQSWALGEVSWADAAAKLAAAGGYLPPWFDNAGVWRWRSAPVFASAEPDAVYQSGGGVLFDGVTRTVTLLDEPNVWIAVNTTADQAPIVGRYYLPSSAPNSAARVGYEIPERVEVAGLATTAAADAAAAAAAAAAVSDVGKASLEVPFEPSTDLYWVVSVDGMKYRSVGYEFGAAAGSTTGHDLSRLWVADDRAGTTLAGAL